MSESFIKETIRCHFAHNYEQVTLLEVNDLLLNVFSQCVKIHIDEQNAIITDIYLQEYSNNPNDDPLCDAKSGAPQKEMDAAIDEINKENNKERKKILIDNFLTKYEAYVSVYHKIIFAILKTEGKKHTCKVGHDINDDDDDDITKNFDSDLSNKYSTELLSIYEHIKKTTDNFQNLKKVIYYLQIVNTEIKSILTDTLQLFKSLLPVLPLLRNQFMNIIKKSTVLSESEVDTFSVDNMKKIFVVYELPPEMVDLIYGAVYTAP